MGVFMTGINHLKRLSRVIVLFYPFSFVLWVFILPLLSVEFEPN
jgi:hypothetical protein